MATGALTLSSTFALSSGCFPYGLATSPDGKNLYVAQNSPNTTTTAGVAQLAIDQTTGALSQISGKPVFINVTSAPRYVTVSPDGLSVYLAAAGNNRIHMLTRNTSDGSLTTTLGYITTNISYPVGITVSPDNAHVYVANYNGGGASGNIRVFSRNTTNNVGMLTEIQSIALVGAFHVAVTPDGNAVYATSTTASTITGWVRDNNPASGTYGQLSSQTSAFATAAGSPATISITDDGTHVYVADDASTNPYTSCFSRDPATNVLTSLGNPGITSDSNGGPWGSALSRDTGNTSLYLALSDVQRITQYDRSDTATGGNGGLTLKSPGSVTTSNFGLASPQGGGSKGPYGIAVTANNQFMYATAPGTDSVDVFTVDQGATPAVTSVTVSPSSATVAGSATQQFSATVAAVGGASTSVTWSSTSGSINSAGLFTAPAATASVQTITVTATSVFDNTKTGTATVTVPVKKATSESITLVDINGNALASLSGLKWAFFDQVSPGAFTAPSVQGNSGVTDVGGNFAVDITGTTLPTGGTGWLTVTDSDGTVTQSPSGRVFSGPVVVT